MALQNDRMITEVADLVSVLPAADREVFERIFHVSPTVGYLNPPEEMHGWIERHFGSVEAVRSQRIVKITNLVTQVSLISRAYSPIPERIHLDWGVDR